MSFFTKKIDQKKRHENISFFTPQNYHPKYDEKRQQKNCLFLTTNYTRKWNKNPLAKLYRIFSGKMNHKNGLKKNRRFRGFLRLKKNEWLFLFGILFMKIGLIFFRLFIINLLLKMIIPLIFADYFVKKWVIYYEVGKKKLQFR